VPSKKKTPFPPWTTTKSNGIEERYIRLGNSQMLHHAMISLGDKAYRIYTHMLLEAGGQRTFTFPYSKFKNLCSKQGFLDARRELEKKGFIDVKEFNADKKKANVYIFSERWKADK